MAVTENTFTGNGSTTTYSFTFPYLKTTDIKASINGTATTAFTTPTATTVQFNTAPANSSSIRIYRDTDTDSPAATFYAGSAIKSQDLNDNFLQNLYTTQESKNKTDTSWQTGDETIISTETWASNNTRVATTGAIDGRVDAKIDTALTTDVSGGDGVTIVDNSPGSGQIRIDLDADIATLKDMQSGAATALAALTSTELAILDGATVSTAELNLLDGVTSTTAELNYVDGVTSNVQTQLDAKQPLDAELTELATMGSSTASALADLTQAEVQILDGATVTTTELNILDGVTASTAELNYVDGVTSNVQTQLDAKQPLDAELTELATMSSGTASALADLTQTEVQILDGATVTTTELNILDGVTATTTELNKTDGLTSTPVELNILDGATVNTSEINKLDGVTASTAELNIVSGKTFKTSSGTLDTTSDTEIPSSKAIAAHVASSQTAIGGFITIADEVSFPTTSNMPANGVVVSINNAAGVVVNGSGVSTTGRTTDGTPATVTINNFPSSLNGETLAAGVGLLVTATSTSNAYNYHKLLAAETDVKQLSDDINDFNARYRVASSAPGSSNDAGDMYFDTSTNKMKVYNGTTNVWDDVASVGSFYVNTISSSSGTGGGSATFNGSAYRFTLSNAGTSAQQHIVSVNGVIQKPNSGTSQPSEGFALSGNDIIFAAAPASGSDSFIITCGSSVSIGTPSANSVNSSHIIDGSIVNADISSSAAIAKSKLASLDVVNADVNASAAIAGSKLADDSITEVKLDVHNAPATNKYLKYTSNGMEWSDGASEGTDVKSTGESGGTKFLREDGDGTSSWQTVDLTTLSASNLTSGTVPDARFPATLPAASGANLTSLPAANLTGTLPAISGANLTNLPASGGAITATASGAIASGKGVLINANGTVSEPTLTTGSWTLNASPASSVSSYAGHDITSVGDGKFIMAWRNQSNGYLMMKYISVAADGTHTWGGDITVLSTSTYSQTVGWDPVNQLGIVGYRRQDYSYRAIFQTFSFSNNTITVNATTYYNSSVSSGNYSGIDITYGQDTNGVSGLMITSYIPNPMYGNLQFAYNLQMSGTPFSVSGNLSIDSSNQVQYASTAYDPDTKQWCTAWQYVSGSTYVNHARLSSVTGTSISGGSELTYESGAINSTRPNIVYDEHANKFLVQYANSIASNSYNATYVKPLSVSGTSLSAGSRLTLPLNFQLRQMHMAYSPDIKKTVLHYQEYVSGSWNNGNSYRAEVTISGTSASCSTPTTLETISNSTVAYNPRIAFDSGTKRGVLIYGFPYTVKFGTYKSGSTNIRSTNFIGLSNAAYSNGATATINVIGGVSTVQSGLTAGTEYYVQNNGTLGTAADAYEIKAGIALSSSSLLIKGN